MKKFSPLALFLITSFYPFFSSAQNVGIGTASPNADAKLHVELGSSPGSGLLVTGATNSNGTVPNLGEGTRLMFYPGKAAFRVGGVDADQWNNANTGTYSVAMGYNTVARGTISTAMGQNTLASGYASTAIGWFTMASGGQATAIGQQTLASGFASTAMGNSTVASGSSSTAMGRSTNANGKESTAMGLFTQASGESSTAMGWRTKANGNASTAMGSDTKAKSDYSLVIGTFNDTTAGTNGRLFEIGNGFDDNNRRNALTVFANGNIGIGTINATEKTEIVGGPSASPTTLVLANRGGFGPAALAFISDYGLASQWRPGYIASNDNGGFTGRLEFFTNGTGSGNLYGSVKGLEVRNGATLTATGSVGSFSDLRLKHDIEPFTDGLNVIQQINPVSFQYNAEAPFATSDKQVGIVAQELEKVAPYMVHQTSEGKVQDMRWVDNQAYVFLLINAVKELQHKVEMQQVEIEKLKQKGK